MRRVFGLSGAVALLLTASLAQGQNAPSPADGFDATSRMRAFEAVFERSNPEARKRSTPALRAVMQAAFSPQTQNVSTQFDKARLAIQYPQGADPAATWAASLSVRPSTRLLEIGAKALPVKVSTFYDAKLPVPSDAVLRLSLIAEGKSRDRAPQKIDALPLEASLDVGDAKGDCTLRAVVEVGGKPLYQVDQTISLVSRPAERLSKLQASIPELSPGSIEKSSAANVAAVLESMHKGELAARIVDADALLAEAEAAATANAAGKDYYTAARPGLFWLMVPLENATVPTRVYVPESVRTNQPVPLVFALHGMGGDEHMFFDSYHQKVVKLCQERGWLLVSPTGRGSAPPLPELIDAFANRYPVDKSRVFVVGHSMGAGHAMSLVSASPERYAAVAPLGGSGRFQASDPLKNVAFFVGVGSEDFAVTGARSLHKNLAAAGVRNAVLKEYPDIEHIMVTQVAAPDVFAFFDEVAKNAGK